MEQFIQFAMHHWQLVLALVVILVLIAGFEIKTRAGNAPSINVQEAVRWINHQDAVIIDIRPQEAFNKGHIVHAQSMAPDNVVTALTQGKHAEKYQDKPIIVVCAQGLQAQKIAGLLKKANMAQVAILKGGISSWTAADLPLKKTK